MANIVLRIVILAILMKFVTGELRIVALRSNFSYGEKVQLFCIDDGLTSASFSLNGENVGSCYDPKDCHMADKLKANISLSWDLNNNSAVLTVNKLTSELCGQYSCSFRGQIAQTTLAYSDFRNVNLQELKSYEPKQNTGGMVEIETDCYLPSATDSLDIQWSKVDLDGHEETISPPSLFAWYDRCSCETECNGQYWEKLTTGFHHQEVPCDNATPTHSVRYQVTITSKETGNTVNWTSKQRYTVEKVIEVTQTSSAPSLWPSVTGQWLLLSLSAIVFQQLT